MNLPNLQEPIVDKEGRPSHELVLFFNSLLRVQGTPLGNSPGIQGQRMYDANFEYRCVAKNTWQKWARTAV